MAKLDPLQVTRELLWPAEGTPVPPPGSSKTERLFELFKEHERKERDALADYSETIEQVRNPMAQFFLELVRADEEKHHALIHAMNATFEKNLYWTRPPEALEIFKDVSPDDAALLPLLDKFIHLEKDGIKEYKSLLRATKNIYRGVFSVLLRSVIKDSEKHLLFLEYLRSYLIRYSTRSA